MRNYETMVLVAPTLGPDAVDRLVASFEEVIVEGGGEIANIDKRGRRTLAYPIQNFKEGIYALYEYAVDGDVIKELERRMRLNDSVLRFITVKTDRKARLVEKGTSKRQVKADKSKRRTARNAEREHRNEHRDHRDRDNRGGDRDNRGGDRDNRGGDRDNRGGDRPPRT